MSERAVDPDVPVREGDYGSRVVAVEPGGAEYIPAEERHGRPLDLFWTWVSPNMEFATVYVGVLPIAVFGGGFWATAVGLAIGTLLGSISHGVLSSWGPRFGVPQMIIARGPFGYLGNLLPAGLNFLVASFGWFVVNSVSGAFALTALTGLDFRVTYFLIVLVQIGVAFLGHNLVHRFEAVVLPFLAVVFVVGTAIVLSKANFGAGFNPNAPVPFGGQSGAFLLAVFIAYGYAAGWNPYASDYTRYLPDRAGIGRAAGFWAAAGVFVSCVLLEVAGAASATLGGADPNPTVNFTAAMPSLVAKLILLAIAVGAVAANALNVYSGAMSFLTLGIRLPLRLRRALVAVVVGIVGLLIGEVYGGRVAPGSAYENFLLAIGYWITPYLAVALADHFLRRGAYAESEFFDSGRRLWQGALAMAAGIAASYPFWDQQPPFLGAVARAHPEWGDLSFFVGFAVAGILYLVLTGFRGSRPAHRTAPV